jgi:outer membrane protein assembly factor BamE (lipoprotein component of BamABCDE complex)
MKNVRTLSILAFAALLGTACTPTVATRGNIVEDYRMAEIVPGVSTRTTVLQSLGSPTTQSPFDDSVWYYIGQTTEKRGIFDPKVVDKKVVVVAFTPDGVVETMEEINSDEIDLALVRRKTPTTGNEISVMQQLLGNVGRFNKPRESAAATAGGNR